MLLGSGLIMASPWPNTAATVRTFAVSPAIWLVIVQWLTTGHGGYLTGRLRTKWVGIHTDETFFRDTANGFMAWALATLLVGFVLGSALSRQLARALRRLPQWPRELRWTPRREHPQVPEAVVEAMPRPISSTRFSRSAIGSVIKTRSPT